MDLFVATKALAALAQPTRLAVFRLLVTRGAQGAPAGEIAGALGVPQNTMSSHLSVLANAGLVASRRDGRSIIYRIDFDGTRALMAFLLEDCCRAEHAVSMPAIAGILPACCPAPEPDQGVRP